MSWPGRAFVDGAAFEAAGALFQRLDVGLQLLDALAAREARGVVCGHLETLHLQIGDESGGARRGARRFAFGFLERVAQDDEVAVPTSTSSSSLLTCAVSSSLLRARLMLLWALMIV